MPVLRFCSNCGSQAEADATFCSECGNALTDFRTWSADVQPAGEVNCARCGASNPPESDFCSNCGSIIKAAKSSHKELQVQTTDKKPSGAWWLLIFVPVVGGIIAWSMLRKQDRNLTNRIFIMSLTITLIIFSSIISNLR
jgi:uncharacterized membrane protein YvbJ